MARLEIEHVRRDGPLEKGGVDVVVTLSRRNLLTLLQKVDDPDSKRELRSTDCRIDGEQAPLEVELVLRCQPDDEHYAERPAPGPISEASEKFVHGFSGLVEGAK